VAFVGAYPANGYMQSTGTAYRTRPAAYAGCSTAQWEDWQWQVRHAIRRPEVLARVLGAAAGPEPILRACVERFPLAIPPYLMALLLREGPGHALWRQFIPDQRELVPQPCSGDPLREEADSPVPGLVHRYPDRVLLLAGWECAAYCRHCTRRRIVGKTAAEAIDAERVLGYIRDHSEVRDVLLSGGDPLMLQDEDIERWLSALRAIPHVQILRIGSRVPVTLPQRITPELVALLGRFPPLYLNTQFNHPSEITPESAEACRRLADGGIPLGNQTVLLKGVNDEPAVMVRLMQELLRIRVRPYYLHQCDPIPGVLHFQTSLECGMDILRALRGHTSGMAVPVYMVDPGGSGKVPLQPDYVEYRDEQQLVVRGYSGHLGHYPLSSP